MSQEKVILTDPARELAELCEALRHSPDPNFRGEDHLAKCFGVRPWSLPFYQIIFTIMQRVELVSDIIAGLEIDDDYKSELVAHVDHLKSAFTAHSLRTAWAKGGSEYLNRENVQPLKGIAGLVRQRISYRKLSEEEIKELGDDIESLLTWLVDLQGDEQDFIRQALIDGLENLRFRLKRVQWVGWGYTLDSLREVIAAYMALERRQIDPNVNPDAAAVLKKTGALIKTVYSKVRMGKEVAEVGDWLLRAYGAGAALYQSAPVIKGLLS